MTLSNFSFRQLVWMKTMIMGPNRGNLGLRNKKTDQEPITMTDHTEERRAFSHKAWQAWMRVDITKETPNVSLLKRCSHSPWWITETRPNRARFSYPPRTMERIFTVRKRSGD